MKKGFQVICDICGRDCSPNGDNVKFNTSGPFDICDKDFTPENRKIIDDRHWAWLEQEAHEINLAGAPYPR